MTRFQGPDPVWRFRWSHHHERPLAEFPALAHINEAIVAPDHVLPPHRHDTVEVCYFLAGRARWTIGDEVVDLGPGDFFISRAGEVHGGRPDPADPNHNFAVGFDPAHLPLPARPARAPERDLAQALEETGAVDAALRVLDRRVIPGGAGAERIYRRILAELDLVDAADADGRALIVAMVQSLLVELMVFLTRCALADDRRVARALPAATRREDLAGVLRWLPTRLADPPGVAEMAEVAGLSAPHLTVVFRRELGATPVEYVTRLRVEEAARRLASTDGAVTDIALDLGFSSPQYFSVVFRRVLGRTPSEWRAGRR